MSGMAGATIDLPDELATIRQGGSHRRADRRRTVRVSQTQAEERARTRRLIPEEIRRPPLVRRHEIQPPIVINVRGSDPARDQRFGQSKLRGDVVVFAIRGRRMDCNRARSNRRPA